MSSCCLEELNAAHTEATVEPALEPKSAGWAVGSVVCSSASRCPPKSRVWINTELFASFQPPSKLLSFSSICFSFFYLEKEWREDVLVLSSFLESHLSFIYGPLLQLPNWNEKQTSRIFSDSIKEGKEAKAVPQTHDTGFLPDCHTPSVLKKGAPPRNLLYSSLRTGAWGVGVGWGWVLCFNLCRDYSFCLRGKA